MTAHLACPNCLSKNIVEETDATVVQRVRLDGDGALEYEPWDQVHLGYGRLLCADCGCSAADGGEFVTG